MCGSICSSPLAIQINAWIQLVRGVGIAGVPLGQLDLVNIVHATVSVAVRQNRQDEENEIFSRVFSEMKWPFWKARRKIRAARTCFRFAKAYIMCPDRCLNVLLRDLRGNFRALKEEAKRYRRGRQRHSVTWRNRGLEFGFYPGADVRRVIKQFEKLLRDIEPLLELGEIILNSLSAGP
jgi:hypothetical protein